MIVTFILDGELGGLKLGLSKEECVKRMGEPTDWLGKESTFGVARVPKTEASVWYYFGGAAGLVFDDNGGVAIRLVMYPDQIDSTAFPFSEGIIKPGATMGQFRDLLLKHGMRFREGKGCPGYWITSESNCIAICAPYRMGHIIEPLERRILMLVRVADYRLIRDLECD